MWRDSSLIKLDAPLFETIETGLVVEGHSLYPISRVKLRDLRKEGIVDTAAILSHALLADLESDTLPVALGTGVSLTRVRSDDDTQITDTSGAQSNVVYGHPNGVAAYEQINRKLRVDALGVGFAAGDTALMVELNDGSVTSVRRVSVGPADSGGTGFRGLRVTN